MAGFEVGDFFADRYEIKKVLGKGGMGMVYLVQDWKRDRPCALKMILPKYATNRQAVRRFAREVNAARQLDHPGVVKIYDAKQHEGHLYYTMEYLEGKSLRAWMRDRKLRGKPTVGLGSAVRILSLLCHALEHAHKITIHRDLSPENVMLMRNNTVKLLDFGLAKLNNYDSDLTRVGISLGKIQYGAPEQRIDAKNVDHRADIYSLGVMFYEMLTGELPLSGKKISELSPHLPPGCDALADKAMAPDPEDRFESAREMRHALTRLFQSAQKKGEVVRTHIEKKEEEEVSRWAKWLQRLRELLPFKKSSKDEVP
ncbi:MAG: hypothetical protein COA73_12435 [Candidatus Hydrogenedentota bacterium]|nr:MAG: hypothetical protein COA73_12435 [Candidatus Hydrogenedentota bacterium]